MTHTQRRILKQRTHRLAHISCLLCTTALLGNLVSTLPARGFDIDGTHETVIGTGGGTQASPWNLNERLVVGLNGVGELTISDGGVVSVSNPRAILIGTNGGSSGTVTVTGTGSTLNNISGVSSIGRSGAATLNVSNGGQVAARIFFIADQTGSSATVIVTGPNSLLSANEQLYLGNSGAASVTVADGGTLATDRIDIAYNSGSTGTLNIGAAAGQAAAAAGIVDTDTIEFGNGTGKIIFNHTDTDYILDADISGAGSVEIHAGTTTLTGNNTYTGRTTVTGGTLVVNGSMGAITLNGGIFGGTATVGSLTANAGTTIAPGNSIGTINVTGNANLGAGSTYAVEVDSAGNSDRIAATGNVTIDNGATVSVSAENGTDNGATYAPSTTYTIITAGGGVAGTFGSVTDNFAFLDAALGYTANSVTLTLNRNASTFVSAGETANQRASANAVAGLGLGTPIFNSTLGLTSAQARTAFDGVSGDVHASTASMLLEDSHALRDAATSHLHGGYDADQLLWGTAYGALGQFDSDGNAATLTRNSGGVIGGIDTVLDTGFQAGVLVGYGNTHFEVGDRDASGEAQSFSAGAYSGGRLGVISLNGGVAGTLHQIDTTRDVSVRAFADKLDANYLAYTVQAFGEAGYVIHTEFGQWEPFVGAALVTHDAMDFTEMGGAAALGVSSGAHTIGITTIGIRAQTDLPDINDWDLSLKGSLAWQHVHGDLTPATSNRFASGGESFAIEGVPMARDTARLELGLKAALSKEANLSISYSGDLAAHAQKHSINAGLSVKF